MGNATQARVLADSLFNGYRLTTMEVTFPRFILAEFNTHRVFSRNSASSRAIPVERQLQLIEEQPFIPKAFPINKSGMSATEFIGPADPDYKFCVQAWLWSRDAAVQAARRLALELKVHKQIANRLLEPFMYHTAIVSSTEWDNFYRLRISPHAQPEINDLAELMLKAHRESTPVAMAEGMWHCPYIDVQERFDSLRERIVSSTARCAAVSYNRQDARDPKKEKTRFEGLATNEHLSPFEHPARASSDPATWANFEGWQQARWFIERGADLPR